MPMELARVRLFDVLRNSLTGELSVVMGLAGPLLELRDKTGTVTRFKFGPHFSRAPEEEAVEFRAALRALRKQAEAASGKKRRPRTAAALLRRLSKKR